jgi:hypothetical protein
MPELRLCGLIAAVVCLLAATPAHAQIYSWRDANGQLVLELPHPGAETRPNRMVPQTTSVRATRYVTTDRSRQFDDLIASTRT